MCSRRISNTISQRLCDSPLLKGIFLGESGQLLAEPGFHDAFSTCYELRIYFLSSGSGLVTLAGKKSVVRQYSVFFQRPEVKCGFCTDAQTSAELWWIDLYGPAVRAVIKLLPMEEAGLCNISDPRFLQEIKDITAYNGTLASADMFQIQSGLYKIFAMLMEECTTSQWKIVSHDNPEILYTGTWTLWPDPSAVHEESYTAVPKAYAEYNFYGTGIKWIGTMNFDCGKADVILDGNYQTAVDTYSPTRLSKQLLYINTKLRCGHHIIKIFCTGEKNDKASNCDVVIESFQSLETNGGAESRKNASTRLSQKVVDTIHACYAQPLTVEQLAEIGGVSRSYLTAKFSHEMGISPLRYLTQVRLDKAKELLCTTGMAVSQVATSVGYSDVFYFSRIFKKEEKVSPSQYRQMYRVD